MPARDSAGDLLLVALKMPPSKIGTYSNLAPVRFSIAGIASWLKNALGLPKSNMNCGFALPAVGSAYDSYMIPISQPIFYQSRGSGSRYQLSGMIAIGEPHDMVTN